MTGSSAALSAALIPTHSFSYLLSFLSLMELATAMRCLAFSSLRYRFGMFTRKYFIRPSKSRFNMSFLETFRIPSAT